MYVHAPPSKLENYKFEEKEKEKGKKRRLILLNIFHALTSVMTCMPFIMFTVALGQFTSHSTVCVGDSDSGHD